MFVVRMETWAMNKHCTLFEPTSHISINESIDLSMFCSKKRASYMFTNSGWSWNTNIHAHIHSLKISTSDEHMKFFIQTIITSSSSLWNILLNLLRRETFGEMSVTPTLASALFFKSKQNRRPLFKV
jgi:hypothetical protein